MDISFTYPISKLSIKTYLFDLEFRLSIFIDDLEGPVLHIALYCVIIKLPTNQTLCIKDSVDRIQVYLISIFE